MRSKSKILDESNKFDVKTKLILEILLDMRDYVRQMRDKYFEVGK